MIFNQIGELFRKKPKNEVAYIQELDQRTINSYEETFNDEYRKQMIKMALDELKKRVENTTFEAFYLTSIQGRKSKEVAKALGLADGSIYVYKERCIKIMKKIVDEINVADKELNL